MYGNDFGWFASAAEELGEYATAREIRESRKKNNVEESYYDSENLAKTKSNMLNRYN
jgi:hypothetical protein